MKATISIAIETSCRLGGVALGVGDELVGRVEYDASHRHAAGVISRLDEMLTAAGLTAGDVDEVYVSAGPGGFTGLRVGVTVARTLAQALDGVRCVAVATPQAVAENAVATDYRELGVVLDARAGGVYLARFTRADGGAWTPGPRGCLPADQAVDTLPRPILLIGEGLAYHDLRGDRIEIPPDTQHPLHLPNAANVWRVGRRMAREGLFTPGGDLLPIYARQPEAVRLWEARGAHKT
jgi:tRNA threonylcarbamoyladenosine biosynthesis protein TsaB